MAKTKISEYSATASSNTDINSINLAEGMAPSLVNNAIRQLMAQLKDFQAGTAGDNVTVGGNLAVTGTSAFTGAISAPMTAGTIDGVPIGGTTPAAGAFTTLAASGTTTLAGALVGAVTQAAFNTVSTTLNLGGAATAVNIGAATGTATVANTTLAAKAITASTTLAVTGTSTLTGAVTATAGVTGPLTSSSVAITGGTITGITDIAVADGGTGASTAAGARTSLGLVIGTDVLAPTGSAASLTSFPTLNQNTTGNAATVTTNANLTGGVTSVGNAATVVTNANLTGDVTSVGNATTLTNAPVIAKVLTGYTSGAGTVAATDSILQAIQKLNGNDATNANLTGAVTSVGNATSLGSFTSSQLLSALTDETGTGVAVFATNPVLTTPNLGTPTTLVLTAATGLPLTTGVTGQLPVANGGTGTATPSIVAGSNVTVTGTWPNQTIASSGSGGGVAYTVVKTANYTAANNDGVLTNTTGGAFTVTLPTSPSVGNIVLVIDSLSQWGTNNLTVDPTALIKIAGNTAGDTLICDITGATVTLVYTGATYGWNVAAQVGGNGGTAVTLTGTQTLTNKTIAYGSNTLTDVVGVTATQTLTNKTLTSPTLTTPVASTTIGVGAATPSASGAGITFPATASDSSSANTLDDYEEGTWTPIDSSGASLSFTDIVARYTKIGRVVECFAQITYPTTANTSQAIIGGLPFTTASTFGGSYGAFTVYQSYSTATTWLNSSANTISSAYTLGAGGLTNASLSTHNLRLVWIYEV